MTDASLYRGPVKRSITIAGHATSLSLEPRFWLALEAEADRAGLPVSALVARIDVDRLSAKVPPNLTSAVRLYLFDRLAAGSQPHPRQPDAQTPKPVPTGLPIGSMTAGAADLTDSGITGPSAPRSQASPDRD